jgi:hypothetical protein
VKSPDGLGQISKIKTQGKLKIRNMVTKYKNADEPNHDVAVDHSRFDYNRNDLHWVLANIVVTSPRQNIQMQKIVEVRNTTFYPTKRQALSAKIN